MTVIWVLVVGMQLALQAPMNAALGRTVGRLPAALVSFVVGLVVILLICIGSGELSRILSIGDASLASLLGGLIGATWVATATFTVSRIGAGGVAAATISGQLVSSLLIDEFGWVGVESIHLTGLRLTGAVALLAGTALVVHRRHRSVGSGGFDRASVSAVLLMVAVGALIGFQHPLNAELAETIGGLNSAFINFATGTVLLAAIVFAAGLGSGLRKIGQVRWYYLLGGVIGLITVVTALTAVETIGAAGLTAAFVTGQLLASVALDRFSVFGLERRGITPARVSGVLLLVGGTLLTVI